MFYKLDSNLLLYPSRTTQLLPHPGHMLILFVSFAAPKAVHHGSGMEMFVWTEILVLADKFKSILCVSLAFF